MLDLGHEFILPIGSGYKLVITGLHKEQGIIQLIICSVANSSKNPALTNDYSILLEINEQTTDYISEYLGYKPHCISIMIPESSITAPVINGHPSNIGKFDNLEEVSSKRNYYN